MYNVKRVQLKDSTQTLKGHALHHCGLLKLPSLHDLNTL